MRVAWCCRLVESTGVSDSAARYWQGRLIEAMEAYSSARFQTAVGLSTEVEAVAQVEAALKEAARSLALIAKAHGIQLNAICTPPREKYVAHADKKNADRRIVLPPPQ